MGNIGYSNPDWGMSGRHEAEERADAEDSHNEYLMDRHKADCEKIARKIFPDYWAACLDDDADGDNETWQDWLYEEASFSDYGTTCYDGKDRPYTEYQLTKAMKLLIDRGDWFSDWPQAFERFKNA